MVHELREPVFLVNPDGSSPDEYAHVLTYNADSTLATDSFTDGVNTWTQTYTYTGGLVTGISKWVRA